MNSSPMIPARLRETTLGDVLGDLHRRRVSGVLEIEVFDGRVARVLLVEGAPSLITDLDDAPVGSWLQAAGDPRLLGEILADLGADEHEIATALRRQARARMEALFELRDGALRFRAVLLDGDRLRRWFRAGPRAHRLTPRDFLHDRPRVRHRARPSGAEDADRAEALALLGLSGDVDQGAVRSAFRRAVAAEHPDRAVDDTDRAARTARVARLSSAFHRLTR
jgi:DnaJ-domain-containing protein 1